MTTVEEDLARCAAMRAAGASVGTADVAWLVDRFAHPLKAVQRAAGEAVAAIGMAGGAVEAVLVAAMREEPFMRRWVAAWTAARIGLSASGGCLDVLIEALGVDDGDVRWAAARLLTAAPVGPRSRARLAVVAAEGNAQQRKMALYCLRDLGCDDAADLERYLQALADETVGVRLAGMSALGRLAASRPRAAQAVAALLGDPDGGVRRAAAATLGHMPGVDDLVRARLREAASDPDEILARVARGALVRLG